MDDLAFWRHHALTNLASAALSKLIRLAAISVHHAAAHFLDGLLLTLHRRTNGDHDSEAAFWLAALFHVAHFVTDF